MMNSVNKILEGLKHRSKQLEQSLILAKMLSPTEGCTVCLTVIDLEARKDENDCLIDVIEKAIKKDQHENS